MKGKRKVGLSCLHIKFMLGLFLVLVSVSFISAFNFGDKSIVTSDVYIINSSEVTHNNLFGLQGGTTGEYYHIRESWYDELLSDIFDWITQAEGDARYSLISEPLWSDNFTKYNTTWSTDTDTFIGNYSTFLTHIDWSDAVNGTLLTDEVDPQWSDNFTKYNTTWSTDTGILWSDAVNGTLYLASNPSNYINWGDAVNGTLFTQTEWDTNYTANNALWLLDTNTWNTTAEIWAVVYNGTFLESETDPKWVANYSTFLTHITWADAVNGTLLTSESDPKWLANYSSFLPLKDNSIVNTLHRHSELVASDGSPDPALSVDASGNVGIGTTSPDSKLDVLGTINALQVLVNGSAVLDNAFRDFSSALFPAKCPSDMVWVEEGDFCIDKYEASNGGGSYYVDMNGDGDILDTAVDIYGDGTTFNEATPTAKAVSVSGANPWVSINQVDAKAACLAAGKHLATNYEWLLAGKGTPDVDSSAPATGTESCQIWNTGSWPDYSSKKPDGAEWSTDPAGTNSIKTGTAALCVSDAGAYDLIGNVWEWTDNVINNGLHPVTGEALPSSSSGVRGIDIYGITDETGSTTSDYNYDYYWINTDGYRGFRRGGHWYDGATAGVFALSLYTAPSNTGASLGFRCASNSNDNEFLDNTGDIATGNYSFDYGTLFIDSKGNNVGIGTTSPDYKLQVAGDIVPETNASSDLGTSALAWDNVYAVTYNDLTPAWIDNDGSALNIINSLRNKGNEIDHLFYPTKLRSKFYIVEVEEIHTRQIEIGINETTNETIYQSENYTEFSTKSVKVDESLTDKQQKEYVANKLNVSLSEVNKAEIKYTRDLGGVVTMILSSIKELFTWNTKQDIKITTLESENTMLKNELCQKDNYSWCKK